MKILEAKWVDAQHEIIAVHVETGTGGTVWSFVPKPGPEERTDWHEVMAWAAAGNEIAPEE